MQVNMVNSKDEELKEQKDFRLEIPFGSVPDSKKTLTNRSNVSVDSSQKLEQLNN